MLVQPAHLLIYGKAPKKEAGVLLFDNLIILPVLCVHTWPVKDVVIFGPTCFSGPALWLNYNSGFKVEVFEVRCLLLFQLTFFTRS